MSEARSLDQKAEEEEFSTGVDRGDVDEEPSSDEISFFTRRRIIQTLVVVLLLIIGIYFLFPKLVGLESANRTRLLGRVLARRGQQPLRSIGDQSGILYCAEGLLGQRDMVQLSEGIRNPGVRFEPWQHGRGGARGG